MMMGTLQSERGMGAACAPPPKRQPQVSLVLNRLASLVDGIEKSYVSLHERLSPVLRPQAPMPGLDKNEREQTVALAAQLDQLNERLENLLRRIQDTEERVEL